MLSLTLGEWVLVTLALMDIGCAIVLAYIVLTLE